MNLIDVLKQEAEQTFAVTDKLFQLVNDSELGWKPPQGKNWMTVGQVIKHCTNSCGAGIKGMVTGDWGMPEGMKFEDIPPEQMMPPAEAMETVKTVAEARKALAADRELGFKILSETKESDLLTKKFTAPWGGPENTLFQHLVHMIEHLAQHKGQLFYYLKWMGKDVNTEHLWGM